MISKKTKSLIMFLSVLVLAFAFTAPAFASGAKCAGASKACSVDKQSNNCTPEERAKCEKAGTSCQTKCDHKEKCSPEKAATCAKTCQKQTCEAPKSDAKKVEGKK